MKREFGMSVISVDASRPAKADRTATERPQIDLGVTLMLAATALALTAFWIGVFLFLVPALTR